MAKKDALTVVVLALAAPVCVGVIIWLTGLLGLPNGLTILLVFVTIFVYLVVAILLKQRRDRASEAHKAADPAVRDHESRD